MTKNIQLKYHEVVNEFLLLQWEDNTENILRLLIWEGHAPKEFVKNFEKQIETNMDKVLNWKLHTYQVRKIGMIPLEIKV